MNLALVLLACSWMTRGAETPEAATNAAPAEGSATNSAPANESITNQVRQVKAFVLKDLTGKEVKYVEAFKGKMLLLFFFTSWAESCKSQIPALVELQKQHASNDFSVVGISLDERGGNEVRLFARRNKVNFPILSADMLVVQDVGGISALPTLCLLDQNRMVVMKEASLLNKTTLEEVLKAIRQHQKKNTP